MRAADHSPIPNHRPITRQLWNGLVTVQPGPGLVEDCCRCHICPENSSPTSLSLLIVDDGQLPDHLSHICMVVPLIWNAPAEKVIPFFLRCCDSRFTPVLEELSCDVFFFRRS